jgi:hypothetical protein
MSLLSAGRRASAAVRSFTCRSLAPVPSSSPPGSPSSVARKKKTADLTVALAADMIVRTVAGKPFTYSLTGISAEARATARD